ncbi:MAG TPA: hypothetical protein VIM11_17200 [Tepidisphaeraceae bacterium]|jgi:hypothetical protein
MTRTKLIAATVMWIALSSLSRAQQAAAPVEAPDRQKLEKELEERLSGARMTGYYMSDGQQGPPKQDQYTLKKVAKRDGDKWLFTAVLAYGDKSMAIPLEIPIYWAGDTPVISVTNFSLMGMGSYTARVMLYKDHYAGTWSSATHGGYLWGKIEKIDENATTQSSQPSKK